MLRVLKSKSPAECETPNWGAIEREVLHKLRVLRLAWDHTAKAQPELHEAMRRDLYIPALEQLAAFCSSIEEEDHPQTKG